MQCIVDVNECVVTPEVCPDHSTCHNENGGFHCTCNTGFIKDDNKCTGEVWSFLIKYVIVDIEDPSLMFTHPLANCL